jgi:hypothetical protein
MHFTCIEVSASNLFYLGMKCSVTRRCFVNLNYVECRCLLTSLIVWQLRSQLDDAIASECPFCGDLMIREISLPFIHPDEDQHVVSWEIKPNNGSQRTIPLSVWFAVWKMFVHLCTINTILCSVLLLIFQIILYFIRIFPFYFPVSSLIFWLP